MAYHLVSIAGRFERGRFLTGTQVWFVDVQDTARFHVAALTKPDIQNERMLAFAELWNAKSVELTVDDI
jgi:nucleoside-diphosphate-sugar epimerase